MKIRTLTYFSILCFVFLGSPPLCRAQTRDDLGNNAALQYLSAFLQLEDADLQDADVKELSDIIAGASWARILSRATGVWRNEGAAQKHRSPTSGERVPWGAWICSTCSGLSVKVTRMKLCEP